MAATRCRSYVCRLAFVWHPRIPDDRMPLPFPARYPLLSRCAGYVRPFHCPLVAYSVEKLLCAVFRLRSGVVEPLAG
jgi:hypothetical protein